ncbi:hypothetical protein KOW79_016580 [Hemibagrus wyckioides]|uniref:Uncharacterized protein n=1 Tax=Hemibagrus wyckioides TaxID=337641 RepID=A0A9D3NBZ9_9TELE|nr:hypothetical protein KOW79_016580 [Hemibagrus wyckioides]
MQRRLALMTTRPERAAEVTAPDLQRNPRVYTLQRVKYAFIVFTVLLYTAPGCHKLPGASASTYTLQQYITSPRHSHAIHHPAAAIAACACGRTLSWEADENEAELEEINQANLMEEKR